MGDETKTAAKTAADDKKAAARAAVEAQATETVEAWVNETLRNGKVAQQTEAWNAIQLALPALIAKVADAIEASA